ncbi:hypothetical protein AQJ23_19000 [Streptomyces antibioticus]|nr:hypothetical protein [Streptomyces antibioticus]KUN24802.1 hypothetical protein AQJ23_19000 [Streptomyces antibioticus]
MPRVPWSAPSYFCWRRPTALADPGLDRVLVYPVTKQPIEILRTDGERLDRLPGRTRSAVLVDVAGHRDGKHVEHSATALARTLLSGTGATIR